MRSASSKKLAILGLVTMLSASGAIAAPTISGWSVKSDGNNEIVKVRWNEPAAIETTKFETTRQVVITVPGATLEQGAASGLKLQDSRMLNRARLQSVTTANGQKGVQISLTLREWADVKATADREGLTLTMPVTSSAPALPAASAHAKGYEFTDEKVRELDARTFGSATAPSTGAGQGPATSADMPKYYVPPRTGDGSPNSAMSAVDSSDMNLLSVQTKLNERVERVDFQGTSLENVLRLIAEEAELNILIKPADVAGRTATLRLRDVTLRNMLDAILKTNDLGYTVEPGGIINIVPRELVRSTEKEVVMETIAINWVDAKGVAMTLKPFIDAQDGVIEVSSTGNMIIVRDVPETVRRIQDLVAQIDVPEKQVTMELRLVNMSETARRIFGTRTDLTHTDLTSRPLFNADGSVNNTNNTSTSGSTFDSSNSVTNTATTGSFPSTTTANGTTNSSTGGSTSTTSGSTGEFPTGAVAAGLLAPGATAFQLAQRTTWSILGSKYDVNFQLNAQEERGEAVTLANPTILSLNNVEAKVEIKRQIPYTTAINTDQGSVGTVEFKDVGTEVTLLPHITQNGFVQMHIVPEQIIDTGARPGGVPQTDERRVEASVIVKDEQTIALGGLRQFDSSSAENGVPYLLRLPVLSWLFKNQNNQQGKTELYLFVTPHIVKDPALTSYQQALYEKIDYNWDLPDYYFDEVFTRKAPGEANDPNVRH
ncbi:hypothetical protein BH09SUM1_BH09SUM1_11690 [soil metagenome]